MPKGSTSKQERQYEHIKEGAKKRGASAGRAKEIAARTVNKERARSGQAASASRSSTRGDSPSRRGGKASGGGRAQGSGAKGGTATRDELYEQAKRRDIKGRSSMTKQQLAKALGR
ncbi:plasmid stabilization protein [Streptomyces marincola]|uniref:plasmid stabilization protein n=1 Tax=Streptomyces marincola TaxID=2878388 RepID=UPI001CF34F7F|nr:plasmid stabilization protein [Streptomyces marincola]UCM91455.1 plasmid stabilization protein [Streptomyces marincola]